MRRRGGSDRRGGGESPPWYENWWAGADVNDTSWRDRPAGSDKPLTRRERDDARRWAEGRRRGGFLGRLLG